MATSKAALLLIGFSAAAFGQRADAPYQVRYASNLNLGNSVVNMTNTGAIGAGLQSGTTASVTGSICANVYTFSPDEQMVSCCSCTLSPGELARLSIGNDTSNSSVADDIASNTLTPSIPTSVVIKLVATVPVGGTCNNSAALAGTLAPGLLAWGTTTHKTPGNGLAVTETGFTPASLSTSEQKKLTDLCAFIFANGSGYGVCRSCSLGALGAAKK